MQHIRLPGQYFDSETNLHYNYFRDYDPSMGRYIQSDPSGVHVGPNTYLYVGANPISYFDPFGLVRQSPKSDISVLGLCFVIDNECVADCYTTTAPKCSAEDAAKARAGDLRAKARCGIGFHGAIHIYCTIKCTEKVECEEECKK